MLTLWFLSMSGLCGSAPLSSQHVEPTMEQLEAVAQVIEELGGIAGIYNDPLSKQAITWFLLPNATNDDLKKLPPVPFTFGLILTNSQVTDIGLKELDNVKHL